MVNNELNIWLEAGLNRRHKDFQSNALPTELSSLKFTIKENALYIDWGEKNIGFSIVIKNTNIILPIFSSLQIIKKSFLILQQIINTYKIKLIYLGYFNNTSNKILLKKIKEFTINLKKLNIPTHKIIEYYTTCTAKRANKIKKNFNTHKKKNFCDTLAATFLK